MGAALMAGGATAGAVGGIGGIFSGKGGVAKTLGLSKEQGAYYQPNQTLTDQLIKENMFAAGDGGEDAINQYLNKGTMQNSVLARESVANDVQGGSRLALDEVMANPLYSGMFGNKGLQGRLMNEEQDLAGKGYKLTQDDREAYGQASGDIARQYGTQEADLMNDLNKRGLASSASGAAGAAFSGLSGNKYESLAKMNTEIADKRMNNNMARLNSTRNMIGSMAQLGGGAQQQQFDRQQKGLQSRRNYLGQSANLQQGANDQAMQSQIDKRENKGKSLLEGLGQGLFSSSQQIGASPGTGANAFAGAAGKTLGSGGFGGV